MLTDGETTSTANQNNAQEIDFDRASQVLAEQPFSVMLGAKLLAIEPAHGSRSSTTGGD
jgi:hypothetical protein